MSTTTSMSTPKYTGNTVPLSTGGVGIAITAAAMCTLATFWTGLRFCVRRYRKTRIYLEDWFILAALAGLYSTTITILISVVYGGVGHHASELAPFHFQRILKVGLGLQISYAIALGFVKASICMTLARIFSVLRFQIAAYMVIACSVVWAIATILNILTICRPLQKFWNFTSPGQCGDLVTSLLVLGTLDVALDMVILILPIPMLVRLQIPPASKIGLGAIFAMGILTITAGMTRTVAVRTINYGDISNTSLVNSLCIVEVSVAIIIASSPLLRPILDRLVRNIRSVAKYGTGSRTQTTQPSTIGSKTVRPWPNDSVSQEEMMLEPVTGHKVTTEIFCNADSGDRPGSGRTQMDRGCIYVATTTNYS